MRITLPLLFLFSIAVAPGCRTCPWDSVCFDAVDHISDCEGCADGLYHSKCDVSRARRCDGCLGRCNPPVTTCEECPRHCPPGPEEVADPAPEGAPPPPPEPAEN